MESSNYVQQGKVFVGGISAETSEETLTQHFSRYGQVVRSQVIKFWETGFGKGFGFVTFADSSVIDQLLENQHIILGRTVDVKLALPKGETRQCQHWSEFQQIQGQGSETSRTHIRKIFVGGLPPDLSEEDFKKYFENFGRIEDAKIIFHRGTNTPRGFGFVTYDSEEAVINVLQKKPHFLNNKFVEVKKAEPRKWRVMDTSYYCYNFYPTNSGYEMWPIYYCHGIYVPHYWPNHTMVPSWTIPFDHLGTNVSVPQPVQVLVPYFTPRYPFNWYNSMHNQMDEDSGSDEVSSTLAHNSGDIEYQIDVIREWINDNDWGSQQHNSASHEGNDQDCSNIEVQLVANGSPRATGSAKPLGKETDNGEKDKSVKNPQVNAKAENGETAQGVKNSQLAGNGEKDQCVKNSQVNTKAENEGEDHFVKIFLVNKEVDLNGEKDYSGKNS